MIKIRVYGAHNNNNSNNCSVIMRYNNIMTHVTIVVRPARTLLNRTMKKKTVRFNRLQTSVGQYTVYVCIVRSRKPSSPTCMPRTGHAGRATVQKTFPLCVRYIIIMYKRYNTSVRYTFVCNERF